MAEYEAGYLQALTEVRTKVREIGDGQEGSPLLSQILAFLNEMIATGKERHAGRAAEDAPDPLSGSF